MLHYTLYTFFFRTPQPPNETFQDIDQTIYLQEFPQECATEENIAPKSVIHLHGSRGKNICRTQPFFFLNTCIRISTNGQQKTSGSKKSFSSQPE